MTMLTYTSAVLRDWKEMAERMAFLEARGYAVRKVPPFLDLEKQAPSLIAEMRRDLAEHPLVREFILMSRGAIYSGDGSVIFEYIYEDHEYLRSTITIMEHANAIYDVTFNRVKRYHFTEEFVSYLIGQS